MRFCRWSFPALPSVHSQGSPLLYCRPDIAATEYWMGINEMGPTWTAGHIRAHLNSFWLRRWKRLHCDTLGTIKSAPTLGPRLQPPSADTERTPAHHGADTRRQAHTQVTLHVRLLVAAVASQNLFGFTCTDVTFRQMWTAAKKGRQRHVCTSRTAGAVFCIIIIILLVQDRDCNWPSHCCNIIVVYISVFWSKPQAL